MPPKMTSKKASKPSGKHSTLRPVFIDHDQSLPPTPTKRQRSPEAPSTVPEKRVKARSKAAGAGHRILTRSRSKQFRFLALPAELRNRIYAFVGMPGPEQKPLDLTSVRIPVSLSPCRQVRTESLPTFFSENKFNVTVRSNWCVLNRHLHSKVFQRYFETGVVVWAPVVPQAKDELSPGVALQQASVKLRDVSFEIMCVCCEKALKLGSLHIYFDGQTPMVKGTVSNPKQAGGETKLHLETMFRQVAYTVWTMSKMQRFNGFSISDINEIASCFRYDPDEDKDDASSSDAAEENR